jgi:hypothetical protein
LAAGPKRAWIGRTITTLEDTPIPPAADPPGTTTPGPVDGDEPPEHWPMARFSSKQARRTAARDLLAASQAARRALEVMTVYECEHGDELLSR